MFERQDMFERFRQGETKIISSVGTMDTGVDLPLCSCIIDARPTKSVIREVQGLGRGLRTAPQKPNLIILDHAGNTRRLGLVTDIDSDVLDGAMVVSAERTRDRAAPDIALCPECHTVLPKPKPPKCPQCGHVFFAVTPYRERDGELVRFGSGDRGGDGRVSTETKRQWYASFLWICDEKGHKPERAYHLFVARFKEKPPWHCRETVRPVPPSVEQRNFVRSRDIAFAKSRGL